MAFKTAKLIISLLLLFAFTITNAQQDTPTTPFDSGNRAVSEDEWTTLFYEIIEDEDIDDTDYETVYDELSDLAEHPININTASRDDLERIPFLSDKEIEDICAYLYRHGALVTTDELAMIEGISYNKRRLLSFFVYVGDKQKDAYPKLSDILKHGKHELMVTGNIPFYQREGDKAGYLGEKYKHNIRYNFKYGDYVRFGFVGAQDAGEPFFADDNRLGYDFYSFYLVIKKIGCLKTLAVGRYRVAFGMGLVANTGTFSLGKSYMLSTLGRTSNNIKAHSSTQSADYLQGAAATFSLSKRMEATAFVSYRGIDATMNSDSSNTIATIVTTGYHRTQTEMNKKNNARQFVVGGNVRYVYKGFHVGITGLYTSLSKDLKPYTGSIYRYYYASGNNFYNIGVSYGYTGGRLSLNGETATGDCGAIATINSAALKASSTVDIMLLHRFYSKEYYSLFSNSFSEGGYEQNESGIYGGVKWQPSRKFLLTAYTDYAYFPWPKYNTSLASHAWDNMLTMTYTPGNWTFYARYRYKMRERDTSVDYVMKYKKEHKIRLSAAYNSGAFSAKTQGDMSRVSHEESSKGWMVTQTLGYTYRKWLKLNCSFSYFDTDDYDSRVYNYEKGLLYSYNNNAYYGNGIRYSLMLRSDIGSHVMLTCKIGTTDYFDRDHISSSYQQINHSSKTDLQVQLRLKF